MSILITGAGLIAAHAGAELQRRGQAIAFYDLAPDPKYLETVLDMARVQCVTGDIANLPELAAAAQRVGATSLVHTAALIGAPVSRQPYEGVRVNVGGAVAAIEAARLAGVRRLVFCSSVAVYDFERLPPGALITEEAAAGPKNLYGATKLAGEHLLTQYGQLYDIDIVHLRIAGVIGRGQYRGGSWMGRTLDTLLRDVLARREGVLQPEWWGAQEYVYVKDVARAFAAACESRTPLAGAYNIGTGAVHDWSQVVNLIRSLVPTAAIRIVETGALPASYLQRTQAFDLTKARRALDYIPQFALRDALSDYLAELQRHAGSY